jgi:putative SOS response-associated peptidase YedK
MCGRFFLSRSGAEIARHFGLAGVPELAPRFNIAPSQAVPLIRIQSGAATPPQRILSFPRWGIGAPFADDARPAAHPINARAETAASSPLFRAALARRRGLVPADGFYEWMHRGRSTRPFAIRVRGGELFAMAAIWERRPGQDGLLESCAILTCEANEVVRAIHGRMPVIVAPEHYEKWLDPEQRDPKALEPLLAPYPAEWMQLHPVDPRVNDPRVDDPRLVEPERDLFSMPGRS